MKLLHTKYIVFLPITLFIATGLIVTALTNKSMQSSAPEEIKKYALEHGMKDAEGNMIVSSGSAKERLLFRNASYDIVYQETYDLFIISINVSPFEKLREEAEATFLSLFQNNQVAACSFSVQIVTPFFANPELSGQQFPLSFCNL